MVCVGGRGSSVCNGDSGGPLSCLEGGRWVLRGAASWVTSKTCPGHTYSVYARVSSYINWITGYVGQGELQNLALQIDSLLTGTSIRRIPSCNGHFK